MNQCYFWDLWFSYSVLWLSAAACLVNFNVGKMEVLSLNWTRNWFSIYSLTLIISSDCSSFFENQNMTLNYSDPNLLLSTRVSPVITSEDGIASVISSITSLCQALESKSSFFKSNKDNTYSAPFSLTGSSH